MNKTHIGLRPKWPGFQIGLLPNWLKEPGKRIGCSQEQRSDGLRNALSAYCPQINNEPREETVVGEKISEQEKADSSVARPLRRGATGAARVGSA
jgi:hypothetical protein